MLHDDPHNLQRFVDAQQAAYPAARTELAAGEKRSHWMWFIFPQVADLGHSSMAQRYGISGLSEAAAYLAHPVLGPRLRECTSLVNEVHGRTLEEIFGYPDDLKFRSSMTLFAEADGTPGSCFRQALARYCGGLPDRVTLDLLST